MSVRPVARGNAVPMLVVVFGFSGDLFRRKLLQALWNAWNTLRQETCTETPFSVIGCSRSPLKGSSLIGYLNGAADEFVGNRDAGNWDEFLTVFSFMQAGSSVESGGPLFEKILAWKRANPNGRVLFYLSVPFSSNIPVMEQIAKYVDEGDYGEDCRVLFEKPAEITVEKVDELERLLLKAGIAPKHAGIVEHFILKHGFKQMLYWMYNRTAHNSVLKGSYVDQVRISVYEQIGSEFRDYPGIAVDSLYNHHAAILAGVLGNPFDQGYQHMGEAFRARLERLLFLPPRGMEDERRREAEQEFHRKLNPRGVYAMCHEDLGPPGQQIPTGVYLEYSPESNRFAGTRFSSFHVKNSPFKHTEVSFEFKSLPNHPHSRERWTFLIDGFIDGRRVWGSRKTSIQMRADERNSQPKFEFDYYPVPSEYVDGYPQVIAAFLRDEMDQFMPLDFQRSSIQVFAPWAAALDQNPLEERLWYHSGSDPFAGFNCVKRDPKLEAKLKPLIPC